MNQSPREKPAHLGPEYGAQFSDPSVAEVYHLRPPYPDQIFEQLAELLVDRPRTVLDVGTGTGEIARRLAPITDRVDAVDLSLPMIAKGKRAPGGDAPNLQWIHGSAETVPIAPPYALVTAGASLHWMDWSVVMPRFRSALTPNGVLAMISDRDTGTPWKTELQAIIDRYSTNRLYRPYNIVDELESRGLFRAIGRFETPPLPFRQSVADYVTSFHARNGFSRDRMTAAAAESFDREATAAVMPYAADGTVTLDMVASIVWGNPLG
jgi:SAM-dependent methyltransferase